MKCPKCQQENPDAHKFCAECGHKLTSSASTSSEVHSFDEKTDKIQRYLPKGLTEKILAQRGKIEEGMNEDQMGQRIEKKASADLAQMIPFYQNLLSLKVEDPKFNALEPEGRKFGTFEAVKDLLVLLSKQKPLVLFLT